MSLLQWFFQGHSGQGRHGHMVVHCGRGKAWVWSVDGSLSLHACPGQVQSISHPPLQLSEQLIYPAFPFYICFWIGYSLLDFSCSDFSCSSSAALLGDHRLHAESRHLVSLSLGPVLNLGAVPRWPPHQQTIFWMLWLRAIRKLEGIASFSGAILPWSSFISFWCYHQWDIFLIYFPGIWFLVYGNVADLGVLCVCVLQLSWGYLLVIAIFIESLGHSVC